MNKSFLSYLDDFNTIVIIVKKDFINEFNELNLLYLLDKDSKKIDTLKIIEKYDEYDTIKFVLYTDYFMEPFKDYFIQKEHFEISYVLLGSITRSDLFDKMYTYMENDLGATYSKKNTLFKVWTPVSKEVYVELIKPDQSIHEYPMNYQKSGIYHAKIEGNLERCKYRYKFRINQDFQTVVDPYTISSSKDQQFSFILDPTKFYPFENNRPDFSGNYNDIVLYEASIRDMTSFYKQSTFNAIQEKNLIPEIKKLGITHIQFMPLFKFYGIDPYDRGNTYNWGYNPEFYNEVEITFSDDMEDPYRAINGLRKLMDHCFKEELSVNMDVVFNHVNDIEKFSYQRLVPGYFYWYDTQKIRTNFSFCGNDINSKRSMVKKLFKDSLIYWMKTFQICGFRFDLMGLFDVDTINSFANVILSNYERAVVYGEGWHMKSLLRNNEKASMFNSEKMPRIAFFNDFFRDHIRSKESDSKGFIDGISYDLSDTIECILGTHHVFKQTNQSINYIECHDNYTLYDQLKVNQVKEDRIYDLHILGTSIVLISLGIPFLHAGQEFFRTKGLVENSYKSLDNINQMDYDRKNLYRWYSDIIRDLIEIRKEHEVFRKTYSTHVEIEKRTQHELILKYKDSSYIIYAVIKNDYQLFDYRFDQKLECIFNGRTRDQIYAQNILISKPGVYLYKKEI